MQYPMTVCAQRVALGYLLQDTLYAPILRDGISNTTPFCAFVPMVKVQYTRIIDATSYTLSTYLLLLNKFSQHLTPLGISIIVILRILFILLARPSLPLLRMLMIPTSVPNPFFLSVFVRQCSSS